MRVYDNKGRLTVDFKLHAPKHESGGVDEVSLAASQITSGRFGKTRLEWTADKLLKGAGVGADPVEIDVPASVPSGLIAMWHGLIANIPSGWVICDGNNSTPNLLAKFIEGVATAATNPGTTGGALSKTTAGHATPSHTLTVAEMPAHTHSVKGHNRYDTGGENKRVAIGSDGATEYTVPGEATSTGDGGGHTHSSTTDSISDIRPPFYDVAFIMKT